MARWTPWKRIADPSFWYPDHGLWLPVCYELGVAPPDDPEALEVTYVGAAELENPLLFSLEAGDEPVSPHVSAALAAGRVVYYRACAHPDLPAAERTRADRHTAGDYPWNEG